MVMVAEQLKQLSPGQGFSDQTEHRINQRPSENAGSPGWGLRIWICNRCPDDGGMMLVPGTTLSHSKWPEWRWNSTPHSSPQTRSYLHGLKAPWQHSTFSGSTYPHHKPVYFSSFQSELENPHILWFLKMQVWFTLKLSQWVDCLIVGGMGKKPTVVHSLKGILNMT